MKLGRNIGSVTIPKRPSTVGGLITWAAKVNRTLQELRDRKVAFSNPVKIGGSASHPWKVTAKVDGIVSVDPGCLIGFRAVDYPSISADTFINLPIVAEYIAYDGGDVTVTAATGFIYVSFSTNYGPNQLEDINLSEHVYTVDIHKPQAIISVYFSETPPSTLDPGDAYVHIPIASVSKPSTTPIVDLQILTHNPVIQLHSILIDDHAG